MSGSTSPNLPLPSKWSRIKSQLQTDGGLSIAKWAVRWIYWNGGLARTKLHLRSPLREVIYFEPLDDSLQGRETILKALQAQGERYRVVPIGNLKMQVDLQDKVISQKLFFFREWEPFESRLFLRMLQPGMTVLDIGAHIGYYALHAAQAVGSSGRVLAFEPVDSNFRLLSKNVQLNHFAGIITPIQAAVSDHAHQVEMQLSDWNSGDHRIYATNENDDFLFNYNKLRVKQTVGAIAIDDYLQEKQISRVDVIKIDVQGAEYGVLRGMDKTLRANPAISMFFEYWDFGLRAFGTDPLDFLTFLTKEHGFRLFRLESQDHRLRPISAEGLVTWASTIDKQQQVDLVALRSAAQLEQLSQDLAWSSLEIASTPPLPQDRVSKSAYLRN